LPKFKELKTQGMIKSILIVLVINITIWAVAMADYEQKEY